MHLTKRSLQILLLIARSNESIPLDTIAKQLSISKRTLYYDISKINEYLCENGFNELDNIRNEGLTICHEDKDSIPKLLNMLRYDMKDYILSPEERKWLYVYLIITDERVITIELLTEILEVSKTTVLSDMADLHLLCKTYEISLENNIKQGYYFEGDERIIRIVLLHSIMELRRIIKLSSYINLFVTPTSKGFESLLLDMNKQFQPNSFHEVMDVLSIFFSKIRDRENIPLSKELIDYLMEQPEFVFLHKNLANENLLYIAYLSFHLISEYKLSNWSYEYQLDTEYEIKKIISTMVADVELISRTNFENREKLIDELSRHISMSKFRYQNGLVISNPFLNEVKEKYHYLYNIVKIVSHHLEYYFHRCLIEDEISFITLHFALHFKQFDSEKDTPMQVLVVCPNGVTTSKLLRKEVEALIDNVQVVECCSFEDFTKYSNIDLILTTAPIKNHLSCPVLHVNPILSEYDKINIYQFSGGLDKNSNNTIIDKVINVVNESNLDKDSRDELIKKIVNIGSDTLYPPMTNEDIKDIKLQNIIKASNIKVSNNVPNWREAIRVSAKPLLNQGVILNRYIDAMIANVENFGPYIIVWPGVALAHARQEDGALDFGISILKLNNEVVFEDGRTAFLIFSIASSKNSHLEVLEQLISVFEDKRKMQKLKEATDSKTIAKIFSKY